MLLYILYSNYTPQNLIKYDKIPQLMEVVKNITHYISSSSMVIQFSQLYMTAETLD